MNKLYAVGLAAVLVIAGIVFVFNAQTPANTTPQASDAVKPASLNQENTAGTGGTPYLQYSKEEYDKALGEGKNVFLDFHANWCPVCRAEQPLIKEAFATSDFKNIVGFEVDYDKETDLKKKFGVPYQHTKVIVGPGETLLYKNLEQLTSAEELKSTLANYEE